MSVIWGDLSRTVRIFERQCLSLGMVWKAGGPSHNTVRCVRSCAVAGVQSHPELNINEEINKTFINRNPRNLEQMALARKDRGWATVWPSKNYYHRLVFTRSQKHVTAQVFAPESSVPVVSCSTQEWAVKRELSSTHAVAACQAVGDVLAQRCQEAGLLRLTFRVDPWAFRSDGVKRFQLAMKEGGIKLCEPRRKFVD